MNTTPSFFSRIILSLIVYIVIAGNVLHSQTSMMKTAVAVKSGYVPVNGMKMYYEIHGQSKPEALPLVVLHGAYMNIPSMGAIIPALAKTHQVYAIEMQGHGRTNDIKRPITY